MAEGCHIKLEQIEAVPHERLLEEILEAVFDEP